MYSLTEGAIEKITNGVEVDKPVLQMLGHKKLSSSSSGDRYRLLVSDGKRINSFTMLTTQLNHLILDNILTEYSVCEITKYAISMVNKGGRQQRVMVILDLEVKVPGSEVGHRIGNPTNVESGGDNESEKASSSEQASVSKERGPVTVSIPKPKQPTNDIATIPIAALTPYQNRWVIKARIMSKSNIRTWSNSRGEGKLFSMDIGDESGEIRCTAFRDQCDKFYDMIEVGNVYYISRCLLKTANKQFNHLKNDYEMTLTNDSEIIPCHDDASDIPVLKFDFVPISELENREKNDIVDIMGVVKSAENVNIIRSRTTGKELKKRDVQVVDESNTMITLTLWGSQAEEFDGSNHPIIALKGARIGEFNGGKNLSTLSQTVLQIDPDIEAAHRLRGWYSALGDSGDIKVISRSLGKGGGGMDGPLLLLEEMMNRCENLETPEIFLVKATISVARSENALYKSCPTESCKKKLVDQGNQMYRCEKCDVEYPNFKYRIITAVCLSDWTLSCWATLFNDEAEKVLQTTAQELGELMVHDNEAFLAKFRSATFRSYIFKLRVSMDTFADARQQRVTVLDMAPINYKNYNKQLLSRIKEMSAIQLN